MTYVVDASIVIRLLTNRAVDDVLRQRLSSPRVLHAPALLDAEVVSGIRGMVLGRKVAADRAADMIRDFADLRITRHPARPHLERVFALRENLTAYDAFYVALAEAIGMPLLTRDRKFAGTPGHRADIQVHP